MKRVFPFLRACGVVLLAASAQAELPAPGSLLVFPEFDSTTGRRTFLTLTNTNNDLFQGTVRVRVTVVSGEGSPSGPCLRHDSTIVLESNDTRTILLGASTPGTDRGFVYAEALSPATGAAISFNYLIGETVISDALSGTAHGVSAVPFRSVLVQGAATDVNANGFRDLDGVEYEPAPDRIHIPRFIAQTTAPFSQLALVSLTGGVQFTSRVTLLVWNDRADMFSVQHAFRCWSRTPLPTLSGIFTQTFLTQAGNDANESFLGKETGWISIQGVDALSTTTTLSDPAILGVLVDYGRMEHAGLPFATGSQFNGRLFPTSLSGD